MNSRHVHKNPECKSCASANLIYGAANSYTFRLGDLPKLNLQVDCGTDFKALRPKWSAYFNPSGLDGQPAAKQVQALTLCFSHETVTIVDNLGLTKAQRSSDHCLGARTDQRDCREAHLPPPSTKER